VRQSIVWHECVASFSESDIATCEVGNAFGLQPRGYLSPKSVKRFVMFMVFTGAGYRLKYS